MRRLLLLSLIALATAAQAVPPTLSHQGRLFDAGGMPLSGPHEVAFEIFDAPSGGTSLWSEVQTGVLFDEGYFSVQLGQSTSLADADLAGGERYLALRVDGGVELPQRLALHSVPYALVAEQAGSLAGGPVDATELRVNGVVVASGAGALAAHVHDASDLQTGVLDVARLPAHEHDAVELSSGTLALDRLPIGTSVDTVARGSHTHTAADVGALPVGTTAADIGALPVGTTAADIGALPVGATAADVGALPVGTTAADIGALPVGTTAADVGALPVGATAADVGALPVGTTASQLGGLTAGPDNAVPIGSTTDCTNQLEGHLANVQGYLALCAGGQWFPLATEPLAQTPLNPAASCLDLLNTRPGIPSGLYWLRPQGAPAAFEAYCDMVTAGGGWVLAISQPTRWPDDMALHLDEAVPQPGVAGVLSFYVQSDWKSYATAIRVTNSLGQVGTFLTADFDGPLDLSAPSWVDAGNGAWNGIIGGVDGPVVTHYQVGQACSSATCRLPAGAAPGSYIYGMGVVFDWQNGEGGATPSAHAHFGGNANIESSWAARGETLYLR